MKLLPNLPGMAVRAAAVAATWFVLLGLGLACQPATAGSSPAAALAAPVSGSGCDPQHASCAPPTCSPLQSSIGMCAGDGNVAPMCVPSVGGDPACSGAESAPAAVGGGAGGDVQVGGGNPINLVTGNKFQLETDMEPLPGVLGLELRRYYNSQSPHAGLLGAGWRMSYETVLYDLGSQLQIIQADGQRLMFARGTGTQATICTASRPQDGQVRIVSEGGKVVSYVWRWPDGRELLFSGGSGGGHPLQAITAQGGERLVMTYAATGELVQVRDPQGRQLAFAYSGPQRRLKSIDTPLGRIAIDIDAQGRLAGVGTLAGADGQPTRVRVYHYEPRHDGGHPNALTGISLRSLDATSHQWSQQRLSTYAYNQAGLAVLTVKGEPRQMRDGKVVAGTGIEQVDVDYVERPSPNEGRPDRNGEMQPPRLGTTIVTNSQGQRTELRSAVIGGHFRLVSMTGAGCSTCGPSNMRYAYNASGQVLRSIRLDPQGKALTAVVDAYDAQGRLQKEGLQVDPDGRHPATRWTRRYEYADTRGADGSVRPAVMPSLVAMPSVVAGREHLIRYTFNDRGQRLTMTEEGFLPGDAPDAAPTLRRTTRFDYTLIHGRSVLTRIRGPLADGPRGEPIDSQVTELHYDEMGDRVVEIVSPGGAILRSERVDAAGRLLRVSEEDAGHRLVRDLGYDSAGLQDRLTETAWLRDAAGATVADSQLQRTTRYVHDALGRLVSIQQPDGTRLTTEFDLAGQPVRLVAPDGSQVRLERDTEGRVAQARRYDGATLLQTLVFERSAQHFDRVEAMRDDIGLIAAFDYGDRATEESRPDAVRHGSGARTLYDYDETGAITSQVLAAGTADAVERRYDADVAGRTTRVEEREPNGAQTLHAQAALYDDFGRKVLYASPEHGVTRYVWDDADHLVARASGGHVYRYSYDVAGHLRATGLDQRPALTTHLYRGALLQESRDTVDGVAAHVKEVRRIAHDAFGRVTRNEHWVAIAGDPAHGLTTVAEYRFDGATGRMTSRIVTDARQREHRTDFHWDTTSGRLLGLDFNGHPVITEMRGTALGGTTAIKWADGTLETSVRDSRGRLQERRVQRPDGATVTAMQWHHDLGDRVDGQKSDGQARSFTYDSRSRLVAEQGAGADSRFVYDRLNNRMGDVAGADGRRFMYRADNLVAAESRGRQAGWLDLYDGRGANLAEQPLATPAALRMPVVDAESRPLRRTDVHAGAAVQYTWGMEGERLSKTVGGRTTHYDYDDTAPDGASGLRLASEADDDGAIVVQYLYADGRMVARIDTPEPTGRLEGPWFELRSRVMGWFGQRAAPDATAYAVHTDQRGAVVSLTDRNGAIAWQASYDAFGTATVQVAQVSMNVRLAGQYFDAETSTHYNIAREYSPDIGRYASADPISMNAMLELGETSSLSGVNPFAYVSGDPLNRTDSQGLYESDVHFYMTYFLAIVAGMNATDARMMALATQYVDDNPQTRPVDPGHWWDKGASALHNQQKLLRYHFTLSGANGKTLPDYANTTITTTDSPQLAALHSYAMPWPGSCGFPNNMSLQFMGEYLHAYEDTFAHRDKTNRPYDALNWAGMGQGHGLDGNDPDFTYNHGSWTVNEGRTLTMESAVNSRIRDYMLNMNYASNKSHLGKATDFNNKDLQKALAAFNAFPASEEGGDLGAKIAILNTALRTLKYPASLQIVYSADKTGTAATGGDNVSEGARNRQVNLGALLPADYPAALLPMALP